MISRAWSPVLAQCTFGAARFQFAANSSRYLSRWLMRFPFGFSRRLAGGLPILECGASFIANDLRICEARFG